MTKCNIEESLSLWLLNFDIKSGGKGTAIVKARNPNKAVSILKNSGFYNGTPSEYDVFQIERIVESPSEMLIVEQTLATE